jgi:hypothetical protein
MEFFVGKNIAQNCPYYTGEKRTDKRKQYTAQKVHFHPDNRFRTVPSDFIILRNSCAESAAKKVGHRKDAGANGIIALQRVHNRNKHRIKRQQNADSNPRNNENLYRELILTF